MIKAAHDLSSLRMISAAEVRATLPYAMLTATLRGAFARGAAVPVRQHHGMAQPDGSEATLLLMPAWDDAGYLGIKIATIYPGNGRQGLPAVFATYILSDATTGRPLAVLDGVELTARRTAAVSALGASLLARADAKTLLIAGAGRVASLLPAAFAAVRPITRVAVWNLRPEKAIALAGALRSEGFDAWHAPSLAAAVAEADIVSCATLATEPLIEGAWLKPGTHLDLVGSFTPTMREADDATFARARIFVDTEAALVESGDLAGPIARGVVSKASVATLHDLCSGRLAGRLQANEITVFKAVGTALADLAAAVLVHQTVARDAPKRKGSNEIGG